MKTVYYNGIVHTADEKKPYAEAFIVEDGRFLRVGTNEEINACGECGERIDLQGKCVIPGLVDSHCHLLAGVESAASNALFLDPATTPREIGKAISTLLEEQPVRGDRTVVAFGFDLTRGTFAAKDLDALFPDRPVLVFSVDGHAALVNTRAMEMLRLDRDTKDPEGGSYYARDPEGNPTGLVVEIPAMMPLKKLMPVPEAGERKEILRSICQRYAALGYTTVFEALSADGDDDANLQALSSLDREGRLTLNIVTSFAYRGEEHLGAEETVALMETYRDKYTSGHVFPDTLKLIPDGTVEEYSALVFEPYRDGEGGYGVEMLRPEEMKKAAALAAEKGFSVHAHAIGDKAVHRVLDVLTSLGSTGGTKTIAHNQLYTKEDLRRIIAAKDIFFQTTPHWMKNDDYTRARLGDARFVRQFPVGTVQRNGVTVTFGSDCSADGESTDAFAGMFCACARGDEALCGALCLPPVSESISREACLHAYTINGARQLKLDHVTGSITGGKSADFVILDTDILHCAPAALNRVGVLETYFCGKKVYPQ